MFTRPIIIIHCVSKKRTTLSLALTLTCLNQCASDLASKTRSSATAEKQRVSYADLSGLANWSYNSLNTAAVQLHRLAKKPSDTGGR